MGQLAGDLLRSDDRMTSISVTKNTGTLLLASYLILAGLIGVFGINLGHLHIVVPLLALATGGLLLIGK